MTVHRPGPPAGRGACKLALSQVEWPLCDPEQIVFSAVTVGVCSGTEASQKALLNAWQSAVSRAAAAAAAFATGAPGEIGTCVRRIVDQLRLQCNAEGGTDQFSLTLDGCLVSAQCTCKCATRVLLASLLSTPPPPPHSRRESASAARRVVPASTSFRPLLLLHRLSLWLFRPWRTRSRAPCPSQLFWSGCWSPHSPWTLLDRTAPSRSVSDAGKRSEGETACRQPLSNHPN